MALITPMTRETGAFLEQWQDPRPFIDAHTSGSTGNPAPIRLLKTDMRLSAQATNETFGIKGDSTLGLALSPDYIAGKMMIVRALEADCRLLLLPVHRSLNLDNVPPISLLAIVPAQVPSLIDNPRWAQQIDRLLIGGAPLPPQDETALIRAGYHGSVSYGMTETCSHVALRPLGSDVYTAMPGITFSTDERGALVIDGSRRGFSWGRLVTNDAVSLLSPTQMLWHGRLDWVINSGGIKMHPEEMERAVAPYLHYPFYFVGRPHPVWGQCVTLVVEAPSGAYLQSLLDICRHALPERQQPRAIEIVDALPRTTSGKIRRL